MEKFEIDEEKRLEIFNNFMGKAKDAFSTLIENIKANIKKYEQAIEDTSKEIEESESSCEKCEHEISKMESKIDSIKETIENVENTYKKMVDAYSSTSKGETKELYSDIIDGAKANCDKDVEKNRSEIARLNSDIEAIKNNIAEFTKIIDELNRDLEGYKLELAKYNKALEYMEKVEEEASTNLENISINKEEPKKKVEKATKKTVKKTKEVVLEPVGEDLDLDEEDDESEDDSVVLEEEVISEPIVESETKDEKDADIEFELEAPEVEPEPTNVEVKVSEPVDFEESLKQIYDLTGYKPKKEEPKIEEEPVEKEETKIYSDNLENLFNKNEDKPREDITKSEFDSSEMSEWERILNGADDMLENVRTKETKNEELNIKRASSIDNAVETVNQLLKPYGTSFERLNSLVGEKIEYKDGSSIPFVMNTEDVIKAVNAVDSNDLKMMRTVGSEITLIRKVKHLKEGKN